MSEIRELAKRLLEEAGISDWVGCDDSLERLGRAALREGMMRAADVCGPSNADAPSDWTEYAKTKAECADSIRAEADKLDGKV